MSSNEGTPLLPHGFLTFWQAYKCERRVNRPAALKEWARLRCEGRTDDVLAALARYKATRKWIEGYMPEPARWLKAEPWHDDPAPHDETPSAGVSDGW